MQEWTRQVYSVHGVESHLAVHDSSLVLVTFRIYPTFKSPHYMPGGITLAKNFKEKFFET